MTDKHFKGLLNNIGGYTNHYNMIKDILNMNVEDKFVCISMVVYLLVEEEIKKKQVMTYVKIVINDLSVLSIKEREDIYINMIEDTYHLIDRKDSYDIGCNHDKIHEFLVDRLDLN
jgi:hypothetical protein